MSRNLAFLFYLVSCSKRCPSAEFGHFLASYLARDFSFVLADRGPTEGGQIAVVTDRRRIVSRYVGQTLPCCARHLRERDTFCG